MSESEIVMDGSGIALRIGDIDKHSGASGIMSLCNSKDRVDEDDYYSQNKTHLGIELHWKNTNYSLRVNKETEEGKTLQSLIDRKVINEINDFAEHLLFSRMKKQHLLQMFEQVRIKGEEIGQLKFKESLQNLISLSAYDQEKLDIEAGRGIRREWN